MINLHRIEKGLTLNKVKPLFGKWFFSKLVNDLDKFEELNGSDYPQNIALSALSEYKRFHIDQDISEMEFPLNLIKDQNQDIRKLSGTKRVEGLDVIDENNYFFKLALSRSSIRNFSEQARLEDIEKAVEISIKTPSVCNRQPWKVHYYQDKQEIKSLLKYQNGNLGFRENIPGLIIITGNLKEMEFAYERHQIFIEGGLFSMTLIYALHSLGIGTCCLNWCSEPLNDWKVHKKAKIPQDQEIIMFIAVGEYEKDVKITISPKKPLTDILHIK